MMKNSLVIKGTYSVRIWEMTYHQLIGEFKYDFSAADGGRFSLCRIPAASGTETKNVMFHSSLFFISCIQNDNDGEYIRITFKQRTENDNEAKGVKIILRRNIPVDVEFGDSWEDMDDMWDESFTGTAIWLEEEP